MTHIMNGHTPSRHLVMVAIDAWGHIRPMCNLAARMVRDRPMFVTMFTGRALYDRTQKELLRNFSSEEHDLRAHVRVIALVTNEESFLDTEIVGKSFAAAFQQLLNEEPVTCAKTGEQVPSIPPPDTAILDMFTYTIADIIRELSKDLKVICLVSCSAAGTYYHMGPGGGFGRHTQKFVEDKVERSGRSYDEIAGEVCCSAQNKVIEAPGMPPMYQYEHYPQTMLVPAPIVGIHHLGAIRFIASCDGFIFVTADCIEPAGGLSEIRRWLEEQSSKVYFAGPALALGSDALSKESMQSPKAQEIASFMDRILKSHGPKSMIYVSFGSLLWSSEPEKIWAVIDVLFERKVPFIMSHASPFAKIPEWVLEKAAASDLALFSTWSPQQCILAHEVTGWFLTHCGWNSVTEALSLGVPMIAWPYQAEQATNAIHVTDNLQVGYELTEVRTGHGLKTIYRTGKTPVATQEAVRDEIQRVLDLAFGADGAKKRENAMRLKDQLAGVWEEGGTAKTSLKEFLDDTGKPVMVTA